MRLGFSLSGDRDAGEATRTAVLVEQLGFDELWLTEDYCERGMFAIAGAVAAVTERITIGLGVVNPWTRHPMLTAMEFGALAEIAEGRAVLGLGASNRRWMEDELGIPFSRPLGALREAVEIIRAALTGEDVTHRGEAFDVAARLKFRPPVPDAAIVLGVKGPRALDLAREVADGVLLSVLSPPPYVAWARERLGTEMPLSAYVVFACDADAAAARDRARPVVAAFLGVHGASPITQLGGLDADRGHAFRAGWLSGRPRLDLADDDLVTTFAIAGNDDDCTTALRRFRDAGLNTIVIRDDGHTDLQPQLETAARCAHALA